MNREGSENVPDNLKLLFQVELGLRLLQNLNLRSEPINVLWVLLQGLPLPDDRIISLSSEQRHQLATARILLPFAGRFTWENALREYQKIPDTWRCYDIIDPDGDFLLVDNCQLFETRQEHLNAYNRVLTGILEEKTFLQPTELDFAH